MTTTTVLALAASSWGVAMAVAPVLQIRHMRAQRSSEGISLAYLGVLLVGFVLWFSYGVALKNLAVILPNMIAFVVGLATIGTALWFRRAGNHGPE